MFFLRLKNEDVEDMCVVDFCWLVFFFGGMVIVVLIILT